MIWLQRTSADWRQRLLAACAVHVGLVLQQQTEISGSAGVMEAARGGLVAASPA
jgi:hypothetical protein